MINWNIPQSKINSLFTSIGVAVTVIKADGSRVKSSGIWDSNSKGDLALGASKITLNRKQIYIAGNIKKAPVPGDYFQQGTEQWHIEEVEAYKPTTVVLAYRIVCQ